MSDEIGWGNVIPLVDLTTEAAADWRSIQGSAEANIFILSLLMWNNSEKER